MTYFFEGKQFGLNEEEVIYSIINMSKAIFWHIWVHFPRCIRKRRIIDKHWYSCLLATSGNDDLKTIIKDELLEGVFDEKDLESLKYHAKATDEEIEYDIDERKKWWGS